MCKKGIWQGDHAERPEKGGRYAAQGKVQTGALILSEAIVSAGLVTN